MTVPVVWYQAFDDERHDFWDQTLLRDVMDRRAWRPVGALDYRHVETFDEVDYMDADGAIVVVPGRQHAEYPHVTRLHDELDRLDWAVIIITGDEDAEFPWEQLAAPNRRFWIQTPRPDRHESVAYLLPNGYAPHVPDLVADVGLVDEPENDWCFIGQITHELRETMAEQLREMPDGRLHETAAFTEGLDRDDYVAALAHSKVALCPSGPIHPDTFRLYEALEAGCIPIVDKGYVPFDFWRFAYRDLRGDPPFPVAADWADVEKQIGKTLEDWPANATRASAWWQAKKRDMAYALDRHVREIAGTVEPPTASLADQITVIIPTSPVAAHPATDVIEETVASVRERLGPDVEILIVADGVRPEQERLAPKYERYLRRLVWLCAHEWSNVLPIVMGWWGHQANAARRALKEVRTPLILFVEHDTPLVGEIDWAPLVELVRSGEANVVRFYHEVAVHPDHEHLMVDAEPQYRPNPHRLEKSAACVRRTMQWSQRPHLASTRFYQHIIDDYFARKSRTMIEDVMHGVLDVAWREYSEAAWWDWRLWLYTPGSGGEGIKRSTHLDWRGEDAPKFDMKFVYPDGRVPLGAPRTTR